MEWMLTQNPEMLELERGLRDHWIQLSLWGSWGPKGRWHAQYWFKGVHTTHTHTHTHSLTHMLTHCWPSVLSKFSQGDSLVRRRGSSSLYICILSYFFPASSKSDWQKLYICFRCTTWCFDIWICCEMTTVKLLNMSISSHSYFSVCVWWEY